METKVGMRESCVTPVRVLLIHDAERGRKLCDALSAKPVLAVVRAVGGVRITARIAEVRPDLIILDLDGPSRDGLETLAAIRRLHPRIPIIILSALGERGAWTTLDALFLGASDHVTTLRLTKPGALGSQEGIEHLCTDLLSKIRALCGMGTLSLVTPRWPRHAIAERMESGPRIEIVVIGASTGGPNALAKVLPLFSRSLSVPMVVAVQVPHALTRLLADRLASRSAIAVQEGIVGARLCAGKAWITSKDCLVTVNREGMVCTLNSTYGPAGASTRRPVDRLFQSVAAAFGPSVLGVVMTGTCGDGLRGCEAIRNAGGQVIVQDEASSVVWGMPGLVHAAGLDDGVYPLDGLATEITRRLRLGDTPHAWQPKSEFQASVVE